MIGIVEIETGQAMQLDAFGQHRIGGAGNNIYIMIEIPQGPAQIIYVNPLTAAGGVAPIGQETYLQTAIPLSIFRNHNIRSPVMECSPPFLPIIRNF